VPNSGNNRTPPSRYGIPRALTTRIDRGVGGISEWWSKRNSKKAAEKAAKAAEKATKAAKKAPKKAPKKDKTRWVDGTLRVMDSTANGGGGFLTSVPRTRALEES
jgi:hypothetical protein